MLQMLSTMSGDAAATGCGAIKQPPYMPISEENRAQVLADPHYADQPEIFDPVRAMLRAIAATQPSYLPPMVTSIALCRWCCYA